MSGAMRMVTNLASMGYNSSEDAAGSRMHTLQIGVGSDLGAGISHLMSGGMVDIATFNIKGIFNAFNQLNLYPLTLDMIAPLNILGTLTPPNPYLGVIPRVGRNSSVWIRS